MFSGLLRTLRCALSLLAVASLASAGACTGNIQGDPASPGGPGAPPGGPMRPGDVPGGPAPPTGGANPGPGAAPTAPPPGPDLANPACAKISPGPSPVRRLTRTEYANTVRDLLGDQSRAGSDFPAEERELGFDNNAEARSVSPLLAERYVVSAETLAKAAVGRLGTMLACDPVKDGEGPCLEKFLDTFGRRAWRRPLEAAEKENLRLAFKEGKTTTFAEGLEAVIQVMLLSPQFMYRLERGVPVAGADHLRLTQWEMASRLSYLLWASLPDEPLLAAAAAGKLGTRDELMAQARRMADDARAAAMVATFSDQWLRVDELHDLDKDPATYATFTPELRESMRLETLKLVDEVIWRGDGKVTSLLTAPYTFVDARLAAFYGLRGGPGSNSPAGAFQRVNVDASQRLGVLTHAGLLAVLGVPDDGLTSPVFRGLFVREHLLCQKIQDPPAGAADESPPFTPTTTAREWSEARQAKAQCGACHRMMDPIGFGLENFDGIGAWRASDRGKPVDARGQLDGTDVDGPYTGPIELARKLASSKQVHDCMATQWFRWGHGRQETDLDACTMDTLKRAFAASGGNVRELLLALVQTDAFLFRSKGVSP